MPELTATNGIQQLLRSTFEVRHIAYRDTVTPADLVAAFDPDLLEQALINLLRNAADAVATEPHPAIEIVCHENEGTLCIAVVDNGHGLNDAQRDQVFVPFFSTKPGGSGIGLSLARRVALGHGGRLTMQSNTPRGSEFTLLLPATSR